MIIGVLWFMKNQAEKREFEANQEIRKQIIAADSLVKLSDGYYQKLVADTLTKKELKKLAEKIVDLENRDPVSITKTIIQPVEIRKETDSILVEKDSVFISDFYPNKENPFLKYTNRFSLKTQKGESAFTFDTINLTQVVTKKKDGLYQVDFKGPDFLQLKSIDIQAEPMAPKEIDRVGFLFGVNYGKEMNTNMEFIEIDSYLRINKFYIGAGLNSKWDFKAGIKIEL